MIHKHPRTDRIGTTGYPGTLNVRGRSGSRRRSTITAIEKIPKATELPPLVISAGKARGRSPGGKAIAAAKMVVFGTGVLVRGFPLWNNSGSIPWRAIV